MKDFKVLLLFGTIVIEAGVVISQIVMKNDVSITLDSCMNTMNSQSEAINELEDAMHKQSDTIASQFKVIDRFMGK